jgi:hypothetical protein
MLLVIYCSFSESNRAILEQVKECFKGHSSLYRTDLLWSVAPDPNTPFTPAALRWGMVTEWVRERDQRS